MSSVKVDNDAVSWRAYLLDLADEALLDAGAIDPRFKLHVILNDLASVAIAYAGRIEIDRGNEVRQPVEAASSAEPHEAPLGGSAPTLGEQPDWLSDILNLLRNKIATLEERCDSLEALCMALDARIDTLERNQQLNVITPASAYLIESENDDIDPAAWDNIDRARAALRGMVAREHRQRAAIRQQVLARVTALARSPERDAEIDAELRQHELRAQELGEIDAIAGAKMDEIAGLDGLDDARDYVAKVRAGWPE